MKKNRPYNKKHIKCVEARGKNADRQPANGMNTIPTRLQTNTDVNIFINTFRMQTLALSPKTYNIKSKGPNCATRSETFSVTQTDCNHFHDGNNPPDDVDPKRRTKTQTHLKSFSQLRQKIEQIELMAKLMFPINESKEQKGEVSPFTK